MHGKYTVKQPIGDDVDIYIVGLNFQGGQYKKIFEKSEINFCKTFYQDYVREYYEDYQAHSTNPTPWNTCPYPAGSNEIVNYAINDDSLLPPYLPGSEKWKVEMMLKKNGEDFGGYNIYVTLRTEQTLLG